MNGGYKNQPFIPMTVNKAGVPYVVRPARPRSYLDFENSVAAARCRVMVVLPSPGARAAPVAPLEYIRKIVPSYNRPIPFSFFQDRSRQ